MNGSGWLDADGYDNLGIPGTSHYQDVLTPEPAPYSRMVNSNLNPMGYATLKGNTSVSAASRRPLQRQHRSMDGLGVIDNYKESVNYNQASANHHSRGFHHKMSSVDNYNTSTHQPPYMPLEVSTTNDHNNQSPNYRNPLTLSNPIPSNNTFWMNRGGSTENRYDIMQRSQMGHLPTGTPFGSDYEQLKLDYATAIEKLNQTMNSIKTFWSPELKRERQLRREDSNRIAHLEKMVQADNSGDMSSTNELKLRMELKDRDDRICQLSALLDSCGGASRDASKIRDLEETIIRLQNMLTTKEAQAMMSTTDHNSRYALENALRRIDELEEELLKQRMMKSNEPRDFTDKNLTGHEMTTLRMKMERSEVELAEKKSELLTSQTRMQTAEETANEMRGHIQLLKDQLTNREQHNTLLQGDVDALRQKLDNKNKQIEQKDERITALEREIASMKGEVSDKTDLIRQTEIKCTQLMGRIDTLEDNLREKEQELDKAKIRLLSHPDIVKEKDLVEKIERGDRERVRLQEHIDQLRRSAEKEQLEQQKIYMAEVTQLKANIENLQKELSDRDILLESQNEKIGDMNRELSNSTKRLKNAMVDKGTDELRKDVESARNEVEKLLKMVQSLEKENQQLTAQCKQLGSDKKEYGNSKDRLTNSTSNMSINAKNGTQSNLQKRIEELEEALRESVSITAEREVHLAQQKQQLQMVNSKLSEAEQELNELRQKSLATVENIDKDKIIRAIEAERQHHLDQLFQLKQEALLAAISEKDTHLALLEKSRGPREEIETIRRHKEALIRKLQQENERRTLVVHSDSIQPPRGAAMASVIPGAPLQTPIVTSTHQLHSQTPHAVEQDDNDGIWA